MKDIDQVRERIAANVRAESARARVPAAEIGDLLNLHRNTVSDRLAGRTSFSAEEVVVLAARLGVSTSLLMQVESGHLPAPVRGREPGVLGPRLSLPDRQ